MQMTRYAELMEATGKQYEIEDCKAGDCQDGSDDSGCPTKDWCPFTSFRVSRDIDTTDTRWFLNLQSAVRFLGPEPLSRESCWAHGDMLEVGRLSSYELSRAHFGSWAITSMPLVLGMDLRLTETLESVMDIITNQEVLNISQHFAGHPGRLVKQWTPTDAPRSSEGDPAQLYATMLYADCDAHDVNQTGWSWDQETSAVRYTLREESLCLDAGPGRRGALELRACDQTPGQAFAATMHGHGVRLVTNTTERGVRRSMCVDANDWSGVNVFLAECTDLHFGSSQVFTIEESGLLSSLQSDFSGLIRRCVGALPNGHGGRWVKPPPDGDPQQLNEPNAARAKLMQLWAKPLPGGSLAILLLNMMASGVESVTLDFASDLELHGSFFVRDVWAHKDIGSGAQRNLSVNVPARDSHMFVLQPMKSDDNEVETTRVQCKPRALNPYMPIFHHLGNFSGDLRISDTGMQPDWIADVNGLIEYTHGPGNAKTYHLFYQYDHSKAGGNGWAHSYSHDLVRWQNLPHALQADQWYDRSGAWDGSLTMRPNVNGGVPLILYDTNPGKNRSRLSDAAHAPELGKDPPHVGIARPDLLDPLLRRWIKDPENPLTISGVQPKDQVSEPSEIWANGDHFNFLSAGVRYHTKDKTLRSGWTRQDTSEPPFAQYGGGPFWFERLPATVNGQPAPAGSPTHIISARGSHQWRLGWYHPANESFTVLNTGKQLISTDSSKQFSWGVASYVGPRLINLGWVVMNIGVRGVVNGSQQPPNSALSMLREVRDATTNPAAPVLAATPLSEYVTLRNGSLFNRSGISLSRGQLFTPVLTGPGHTAELLATFALTAAGETAGAPSKAKAVDSFRVAVLAASDSVFNSTLIEVNITAPSNTGLRSGVVTVGRPHSTTRQGLAVNWTAPFALPRGATELPIRVFVDRSIVEVFVAGVAGVQGYKPPSLEHTAVHLESALSKSTASLQVWPMGCGWM